MKVFPTYLAALFLTCVFLLHGASSTFPGLFVNGKSIETELFSDMEQEKNKETAEEKNSEPVKELYHHTELKNICPELSIQSGKQTAISEFIYNQYVFISIPTPPPEALS